MREAFFPLDARELLINRILAVDDEPLLLELVVEELRTHGFDVEGACDGESAKVLLDSGKRYDLLVTDIRMPGKVDGLALGQYFLGSNQLAEVVYMTGYAEIPQTLSTREKLLRKPFRIGQLVALVTDG